VKKLKKKCTVIDVVYTCFVDLLFSNDTVTGLHDIDEYIQSQLLLAVSLVCSIVSMDR